MLHLLGFVVVVVTFFALSDVIFVAARRLLGTAQGLSDRHLFFLTRGLGPAAVSVGMYVLMVFFPRRPSAFYVVVLILAFAALGLYGRRHLSLLGGTYRTLWADLRRLDWRQGTVLWVLVALVAVFVGAVGVGIPITEHDSLAAAMEARIMYRDMSLDLYLAVTEPDPVTGFYIRDFRAPFLHGLYLWFGLFTGEEGMDLLARTVTPLYGWHCLILLAYTVARRHKSPLATAWSAFLLAATPIFVLMSYFNGVDTPRLYLAFLALLWLAELTRGTASPGLAVGAGAVSGWALYSHLINAPMVAGGGLAFLVLSRERWRKRLAMAVVVALVAGLAGAQFHYLQPGVLKQLSRTFSWSFVEEWAELSTLLLPSEPAKPTEVPAEKVAPPPARPTTSRKPPPAAAPEIRSEAAVESPPTPAAAPEIRSEATVESPPPPPQKASSNVATLKSKQASLEARGQGGDPLSQLVFGRLQMFTGIEYFGWFFYLFAVSAVVYLRRSPKSVLDKILMLAAVVTAVTVLAGMRQVSWSNPRYIGSLVMCGAYFSGPWLAAGHERLKRRRPRLGKPLVGAGVAFLLVPLCLTLTILGAKIVISNKGTFYSDFRSLRWVGYTLAEPAAAARRFWQDYMGIRKTIRYLWADPETQLEQAHDSLAAVLFMKRHTPPTSRALVFRDARFFYYAERPGFAWNHPEITGPFQRLKSAEELHRFLLSKEITHVVVDSYSEKYSWYQRSQIGELLAEDRWAELVWEGGIARVYRLRPGDAAATSQQDRIRHPETPTS